MLVVEQKQKKHLSLFRMPVTGKNIDMIQSVERFTIEILFPISWTRILKISVHFYFSLQKCQLLLERSDSAYSQLLATTTLTKLISRTAQVLSLQQRIDIRKYSYRSYGLHFNWVIDISPKFPNKLKYMPLYHF